jgi:hypothetical protein
MINERDASFATNAASDGHCCGARGIPIQARREKDAMTNVDGLDGSGRRLIAACYWLMMRVQSAAARRSNATSDNSVTAAAAPMIPAAGMPQLVQQRQSSSDNSVASDSSSSSDSGGGAVAAVAINATVSAEDRFCAGKIRVFRPVSKLRWA